MSSATAQRVVNATSKLGQIIAKLNAKPKLTLPGVKSLKLSYAYKNDHFGARHFAKEDLPRIRWANPDLDIQVERALKSAEEHWRPELEVEFENGQTTTLNLQDKHSSAIIRELMDTAGGPAWKSFKAEILSSGAEHPLFAKDTPPHVSSSSSSGNELPNLAKFRELNPSKPKEEVVKREKKEKKPAVAATPLAA